MNVDLIKRASALLFAALLLSLLSLPAYAVTVNGGGPGNNNNSPAANGGDDGAYDPYDAYDPYGTYDSYPGSGEADIDGESEAGEVLGAQDNGEMISVGVIIAIIIAAAVVVLVIALIPRGTNGT